MNRHFSLVFLLVLYIAVAQAGNWQWLRNTGLEALSDADWEILSETLNAALDTAVDGETRQWSNPKSGNRGEISILGSTSSDDSPCRQVQISTQTTKKREGESLTFCKNPENQWLITPSSSAQGKTK
jgi:surface antigen